MKAPFLYFCLFFLIGLLAPKFLYGQVERFQQGEITIAFGTNIIKPDGNRLYFTNEDNAILDFSGVDDLPQIKVVFQKLKWKEEYGKGEHYFVVKNAWIKDANGLLNKVSMSNIKTKSRAKRFINFSAVKNGKAKIVIEFGIMGPEEAGKLDKVKRIGVFVKEFTLTGVGEPTKVVVKPEPATSVSATPAKVTPKEPTVPKKMSEITLEKSKEEDFWKVVQDIKSYSMYKTYLKEFPNSKFVNEAEKNIRDITIKAEILEREEREGGSYFYKIKILDAEDIKVESYDLERLDATIQGNTVEVLMLSPASSQKIVISGDYGRKIDMQLDPEITLLYSNFGEHEDRIEYEIGGGEPPYNVTIVEAKTEAWVGKIVQLKPEDGKPSVTGSFMKADLIDRFDLEGSFKIQLTDRRKSVTILSDKVFEFQQGMHGIVWIVLGVMLIMLVGIFIIIKKNI